MSERGLLNSMFVQMKPGFLFFAILVRCCSSILLSPLENNDNLKHLTKQFVAEWQWESWPIKQELTAQDNQSPGPRINVALWKEPSRLAWYLFGGTPVDSNITKVYSDIWKYSVTTRTWEMFFPHPSVIKNQDSGKMDGMMFFRSDILDEITESKKQLINFRVLLCGNVAEKNLTSPKKLDFWSIFYKRKKPEEEKKELKSLAVYIPGTSKMNTVWQMDVKQSMWTAYVCCCNTTNSIKGNITSKPFKSGHDFLQRNGALEKNIKIEKKISTANNESSIFDSKINQVEDEIDNTQLHLSIKNLNKKKKINQYKNGAEKYPVKVKLQKKRNVGEIEKESNETRLEKVPGNGTDDFLNNRSKKEKFYKNLHEEQLNRKRKGISADKLKHSKMITQYCPEKLKGDGRVSWCDGKNGALITTDMSLPYVVLWVFNLRASNWTKVEVKISDHVEWSLCSDLKTVRYAEVEEEVYLFCTSKVKPSNASTPSNDSTEQFGTSQKDNPIRKLVFRINYKEQILDSLGEIQLNSYFGTPEGEEVWRNPTKSTLQAIKNLENETVLVLAYLSVVDFWILTGDSQSNKYFDLTEKIWRGSALKWFDKYNAPFYNLQFVSESGKAETILIRNPRPISVSEYWGRERGRFIIRIFRNENLKNQTFENRTREQNLTYELLQSDRKPPGIGSQFNRTYSYFIFFGISLIIFKVFIFVIFVKRLIRKSDQIKIPGECRKSTIIIRYSVIADELLQPVT